MHTPFPQKVLSLPPWVRSTAVVLALFCYCIGVGYFTGRGSLLTAGVLVALPTLALVAIAVSRFFQFCVVLLPLVTLVVQIEFPTGTASPLPISLALTLLLSLVWIVSLGLGRSRLTPSLLNRPLLAFGAIVILSLVWGIVWRDPVLIDIPKFLTTQIGAMLTILLSLITTLLVGNFFKTQGQLKFFIYTFLIVGGLMTVIWLFNLPLRFIEAKGLWCLWFLTLAWSVVIAQPGVRWYWRVTLFILMGMALYLAAGINASWLSGWVPGVVGILAATFLRSRKWFLVLLLVCAIGGVWMRGYFVEIADENVQEGGLERLDIWAQNWLVVRSHWLLGTGPAGYAIYYLTYYRDTARSTHNNYLDILAQFGFSGAAIWVWLSLAVLWEGWNIVQRAPPGSLRTLAIAATGGWLGALVSMMLGDWVLPFAYNQGMAGYKYTIYTWMFLGTLIAIKKQLAAKTDAEGSSGKY